MDPNLYALQELMDQMEVETDRHCRRQTPLQTSFLFLTKFQVQISASYLFQLPQCLNSHDPGQELGEGNGTPLQYSCLENPMDRGAWQGAVHGVSKSQTRLSNFTFTFHFHALEKEMATHCSVLAWRIPGMGEPGGLLSMGPQRVEHN